MARDIDIYWSGVGEPVPGSMGGPEDRTATIQVCPSCDRKFSVTNPTAYSAQPGTLAHKPNCWFLWLWFEAVNASILDPTGSSGGGPPGGGGGGGSGEYTADTTAISADSTAISADAA